MRRTTPRPQPPHRPLSSAGSRCVRTLSAKRQLTLSVGLCQRLGITPGDVLTIWLSPAADPGDQVPAVIRLSAKHQITLPVRLCAALVLDPGERLWVRVQDGLLRLEPLLPRLRLEAIPADVPPGQPTRKEGADRAQQAPR